MNTAGWLDVWNLVCAIVARQSPFVAIMIATLGVFAVVMALEGVRTSLLAIWRGHKQPPALAPPPRLQDDASSHALVAAPPLHQTNSAGIASRFASLSPRRPKPLTLSPRQFRSPRPKIRRHPRLEFAALSALPENTASAAYDLRDAI